LSIETNLIGTNGLFSPLGLTGGLLEMISGFSPMTRDARRATSSLHGGVALR
jgi:hypothetical protein